MSIFKTTAFLYKQFDQEFLSLTLPFGVLKEVSKVLVYGEDKYGYQRNLNERHYKKIKNDILKSNSILPTSIILSADSSIIHNQIQNLNSNVYEFEINLDETIFRIVDGQHRLRGLEDASKECPEINDFVLNVIIILIRPLNRVLEVEVFRDINSLAKKIKTDLTLLAIYNYELLEEKEIDNLAVHVAIKTAYLLNEKMEKSVWRRAIQFDVNTDQPIGIIGVSAFISAIEPMAKELYRKNSYHNPNDREGLMDHTENLAKILAEFIDRAWAEVKNKWAYCFKETSLKEGFEYITVYFDDSFYIQKTTGTNALNSILYDCVINEGDFSAKSIEKFRNQLSMSKIKADEWKVGGIFSGLTSGSGFKKAKLSILPSPENTDC